ncbi:hypothetical protein R1sor_025824 [Riccia sorocarpa]|uniref:Uncharacterized protein n=1 Tax=Riccia sorocarpa TaxID=122646 RepID=A0ABD3GB30_9MARC
MNISSGSSGSSSSCCEGEEEVVSHLRSSSFYRNVNSVSSPDPGYRYPTKKDNAAPPASTSGALDYRREEDCAGGQEQQDESEKEPIHSARSEVQDCEPKAASQLLWRVIIIIILCKSRSLHAHA